MATSSKSLWTFNSIWSASPPPSPTFAVAPGGTALLVKTPLVVQAIRPPCLERWFLEARLCIGLVRDSFRLKLVVAVCYGYPRGHPSRCANEAFLRDVLTWLGMLTCPSMLLGDLNDHPSTSACSAEGSRCWHAQNYQ